ncbi:MAG TPA: cytochrome c3 family protein [Bryobacteraceae bacterium]|jgi:predicted CXXCH cytochrome family protein
MALLAAGAIRAQDSDTILLKNSGQTYTIVSQVKDPHEQEAFLDLYREEVPAERLRLAESFMKLYPQSWLLSQVYDAAARASIDLGQYALALDEARFSLRLMPENPTLLVLVANVEAQTKRFAAAQSSAREAIEYLDQFVNEANWDELRASAYFALGRTYAATNQLPEALQALNRASAWNRNDAEIFYLRALVELGLHQGMKAASDLTFVAGSSSLLDTKAQDQLRRMQLPAILPEREIGSRGDVPEGSPSVAIREGYAGSAACESCHAREHQTWRETGMANMLRVYQPQSVIGNFSAGSEFQGIRMGIDRRPYFEFQSRPGQWQRFRVDYTIGSKWQQGYATKLPDGSFHVFPIEYNSLRKAWVNYWEMIDPPGSERAVITDFPKLLPATNYQENCAICHTSQLMAAVDGARPMEHATFLEAGVNCEMCHGPSARHVKQMRAGQVVKKDAMEPPVDFRRIGNREGVRICAQCHRQTAVREIGKRREMNYSATTASFLPKTWSRNYDAFSRRAFYKDGRFRETTFIVEAFSRSACYRKGVAQCATCHAPHLAHASTNPTSLKYQDKPDELCLSCHASYRGHETEHTRHAAGSEGSRCVSCHMPRIVNALLFQARSHEIEIPRADLTERFGQSESPNACLLCHVDKDARWAERELQKW